MIGVLALQGDFAEHIAALQGLEVEAKEVRTVSDLADVQGLIIPGGESTALHLLLQSTGLDANIQASQLPILGTCAGAILLSDLGLLDVDIERNAYGPQIHSVRTEIMMNNQQVPASFIRAPKIIRVAPEVEVLATYKGDPVLVRQGNILAATFHTEVTNSTVLHELFTDAVLRESYCVCT